MGDEQPRRAAGRGDRVRLGVLRQGPGPDGGTAPGDRRPRTAQGLGRDHRLHPGSPADPRPAAHPGGAGCRHRRRGGRRSRDDVGARRLPGRGRPRPSRAPPTSSTPPTSGWTGSTSTAAAGWPPTRSPCRFPSPRRESGSRSVRRASLTSTSASTATTPSGWTTSGLTSTASRTSPSSCARRAKATTAATSRVGGDSRAAAVARKQLATPAAGRSVRPRPRRRPEEAPPSAPPAARRASRRRRPARAVRAAGPATCPARPRPPTAHSAGPSPRARGAPRGRRTPRRRGVVPEPEPDAVHVELVVHVRSGGLEDDRVADASGGRDRRIARRRPSTWGPPGCRRRRAARTGRRRPAPAAPPSAHAALSSTATTGGRRGVAWSSR